MKFGQFRLLFGAASRCNANDVSGLFDFVCVVEKDEGLPILGGGAGGGEGHVVRRE